MNNSLRIFLVFFCVTGLSVGSLYIAAKHFCIDIAFLVSCDPRDQLIFLCSALFPFIAFPVAAILCAVNITEKTVPQKISLGVLGAAPTALTVAAFVTIYAYSHFYVKVSTYIECHAKELAFQAEVQRTPVKIRVIEVKLIKETNLERLYEFTVIVESIPYSLDWLYFNISRLDNKPSDYEDWTKFSISNYTDRILMLRKDGKLIKSDSYPNKSGIEITNTIVINKGFWKERSDGQFPKMARIVMGGMGSCKLKAFDQWVDLPTPTGESPTEH